MDLPGDHQRDFGPLPARGEVTDLKGVSTFDLKDGRIEEERVYWDGANARISHHAVKAPQGGVLPGGFPSMPRDF